MKTPRYLSEIVGKMLKHKMVFIGGPRQVGKTTLAKQLLGDHPEGYLNWDDPAVPRRLRSGLLPPSAPLIVLDEIHKYARWRNLVKGFYDTQGEERKFLVTGSARLDFYRRGGDSLLGRYHYLRLHPFSLLEVSRRPGVQDLERLLKFGGFPEPWTRQDEDHHRLWSRERTIRVVREDLRDLERVKDISLLEHLAELLPTKVGSPLSIKSLREDLEVDHKTVERWLLILENLYFHFRIAPYGSPKIRAVKKEQKLYLWDWSQVEDPGARFENLVACQLLKFCHLLEDTKGHRMELRYIRDTDKREVDFVVLRDRKPLFAVETKTSSKPLDAAIPYFADRTPIPLWYQVHAQGESVDAGRFKLRNFVDFCLETKMP